MKKAARPARLKARCPVCHAAACGTWLVLNRVEPADAPTEAQALLRIDVVEVECAACHTHHVVDVGRFRDALATSARLGAPATLVLERLAGDVRADLRRRAEARARTIPVRLCFPLVACVLPAFALLTVAPVVFGGLHT